MAGSPPNIKVHTAKTRLKMRINSGLAIAVRLKDIQENKTLEFPSLKAVVNKLGVKYEKLIKFIANSSPSISPLKGRYTLESLATPKRKIMLNKDPGSHPLLFFLIKKIIGVGPSVWLMSPLVAEMMKEKTLY